MQEGIRLAGPSRELPLEVKLQILFGGPWSQMGWFCFGIGSLCVRMLHEDHGLHHSLWSCMLDYLQSGFFFVFPVVGLPFIWVGLRKGLRAMRLLRHGIHAHGRLVCEEDTGVDVGEGPNGRDLMKMTFEFKTLDGRTARCTTMTSLTEDLKDREEALVYDLGNPSLAVLLDDLPGKPHINADTVVLSRGGWSWYLMLLPGGTILLHVLWSLSGAISFLLLPVGFLVLGRIWRGPRS